MNRFGKWWRRLAAWSMTLPVWAAISGTAWAAEAEAEAPSYAPSYFLVIFGVLMGMFIVLNPSKRRDRPKQELLTEKKKATKPVK